MKTEKLKVTHNKTRRDFPENAVTLTFKTIVLYDTNNTNVNISRLDKGKSDGAHV